MDPGTAGPRAVILVQDLLDRGPCVKGVGGREEKLCECSLLLLSPPACVSGALTSSRFYTKHHFLMMAALNIPV